MSTHHPLSLFVFGSLEKCLDEIQRKGSLISRSTSNLGEPIHNLRVDCRKGLAALDFYKPVIPQSCHERLRSKLRKFLRRSNLGRDLDVIIQALQKDDSRGAAQLLRRLKKDRKREFRQVQKKVGKLEFGSMKTKLHAQMQGSPLVATQAEPVVSAAEWAKQEFQKVALQILSDIHVGEWDTESAHQLRLRIKKLRYSLELATSIAGEISLSMDESLLTQVQRMLGEINDLAVRIRMLRGYQCGRRRREVQAFLKKQIATDNQELDRRLQQWSEFWTPERQSRFYGALAKRTF